MKLATMKDSTRDGRLVVVSKDLTRCTEVGHIARTLQAALDDWAHVGPRLARVAEGLEAGSQPTLRFHEHDAASPLPRAYHRANAVAYLNHLQLDRRAHNADLPESFRTDPLVYQGGSDAFTGPRDAIRLAETSWGLDFEGGVAVIIDDVAMGADVDEARAAIRLVLLVNDISLRNLIPNELAKGFGPYQSRPSSAFSPVAISTDELGEAWDGGRLVLPLLVTLNGKAIGRADAGADMAFDFPQLIAHAAKTRPLVAGTIITSGPVSNMHDGGAARKVAENGAGHSSLAEVRAIEMLGTGAPITPFLTFGNTIRMEMKDRAGHSIFGAIEQTIEEYERA